MDPDEFRRQMQVICDEMGDDPEIAHQKMDGIMCMVLSQLGYSDGVEVFQNTRKWYA